MDELALISLRSELLADCRVAVDAWRTAEARFDEGSISGLEGCAHHLCRLYNVVEQMAMRVARAFENHLEEDGGWHAELIRRLSIPIDGIRPALFDDSMRAPLRELRGFRHVVNHAYELTLDRDRMALLVRDAGKVAPLLERACESFCAAARKTIGDRRS